MDMLQQLAAAGIRLSLVGGTIRAEPRSTLTDEYRELIRQHRPAILELLSPQLAANDTAPSMASETDQQTRHRRWLIDGVLHSFTPPATEAEVRSWYPGAEVGIDVETETAKPVSALAREDEAQIRWWLASIGESNPTLVAEILKRAATDPEARAYYLHSAIDTAIPAFYERTLGNTPKAIASLEPHQRMQAARLGLLPREIAEGDMVVLAYRRGGAQGLLTVPAERYDGLRVLEIFDLEGLV